MTHTTDPPSNKDETYQSWHDKDKADDLVTIAKHELKMLAQSRPKQSQLEFKKSVVIRCERIRNSIYDYWNETNE